MSIVEEAKKDRDEVQHASIQDSRSYFMLRLLIRLCNKIEEIETKLDKKE